MGSEMCIRDRLYTMATRLTPFSRLLIVLIILAVIIFGGRYLLQRAGVLDNLKNGNSSTSTNTDTPPSGKKLSGDDVMHVQLFTFGNSVPGLYYNNGTEPNDQSRFYKDYGLKVKFHIIDDFDGSRQAFRADEVHLFNNETSAMTTEMEGLQSFDPQVVMQLDWSRGADAVVAKRTIKSINDLRGKKVAVTPSTPSQTLLLFMLDAAGLKPSEIDMVEVQTAQDAETAFKSGKVDAAVVWDPGPPLAAVPGSHILESTTQASNIISDVFMGKRAWINANKDKVQKFYDGWMKAVGEINSDPALKAKAIAVAASSLNLTNDEMKGMVDGLRLTNHGDNLAYFGLDKNYKGMTGEQLYTKMGDMYQSLGLAKASRPNWRQLANITAANGSSLSGPAQQGEGSVTFTPATATQKTAGARASKAISINFPTGVFTLDENAKTIIDLQFADVAKAFASSRVRIEGNTDNVGNDLNNIELSRKRAESVARYLESTYAIDPNRFVIVGNGEKNPVPGCESNATAACKAKNRRTEFQLIGE